MMTEEGMRGGPEGALTPEEEHRGWLILRRCDAFGLLEDTLDAFERDYPDEYGEQDLENARDQLRILSEEAENARWSFKQRHGIA